MVGPWSPRKMRSPCTRLLSLIFSLELHSPFDEFTYLFACKNIPFFELINLIWGFSCHCFFLKPLYPFGHLFMIWDGQTVGSSSPGSYMTTADSTPHRVEPSSTIRPSFFWRRVFSLCLWQFFLGQSYFSLPFFSLFVLRVQNLRCGLYLSIYLFICIFIMRHEGQKYEPKELTRYISSFCKWKIMIIWFSADHVINCKMDKFFRELILIVQKFIRSGNYY